MTKSNKISLVIICIFLAILFVGCLLLKKYASGSVLISKADQIESKFADKVAQLDEYDNTIYYIGNISSFGLNTSDTALLASRLTVLKPSQVNEDNMPVPWEEVDHNYYDKDGKLERTVPGRKYSKHMVIVIDSSVTLSDSEWETVRQCAVDNSVPVLVFGKTNILKFQDTLLLKVYYGDEIKSYAWINCTNKIDQPVDFELGADVMGGGADSGAADSGAASAAGEGDSATGDSATGDSATTGDGDVTESGDATGAKASATDKKTTGREDEYSSLSALARDIKFIDFLLELFEK